MSDKHDLPEDFENLPKEQQDFIADATAFVDAICIIAQASQHFGITAEFTFDDQQEFKFSLKSPSGNQYGAFVVKPLDNHEALSDFVVRTLSQLFKDIEKFKKGQPRHDRT